MYNRELKDSGLAASLQFTTKTVNAELIPFIGKRVRYRKEFRDKFIREHAGLQHAYMSYRVMHTQRNWAGKEILRGYLFEGEDTFGAPLDPAEIEIIGEEVELLYPVAYTVEMEIDKARIRWAWSQPE